MIFFNELMLIIWHFFASTLCHDRLNFKGCAVVIIKKSSGWLWRFLMFSHHFQSIGLIMSCVLWLIVLSSAIMCNILTICADRSKLFNRLCSVDGHCTTSVLYPVAHLKDICTWYLKFFILCHHCQSIEGYTYRWCIIEHLCVIIYADLITAFHWLSAGDKHM